jgi:Pentapeptide repeats (8 copies)
LSLFRLVITTKRDLRENVSFLSAEKQAIEAFMAEPSAPARWLPRISIRGLCLLILLLALLLGWVSSWQRAERERRLRESQLHYAEEELRRAKDELRDQLRRQVPRSDRTRSFWEADLEGSDLAGMTIASNSNAFQRASFRKCRLESATLQGGDASFQLARFDGARLARAYLKGGSASFQASSFAGADLAGATLTGGTSSFQGSSFEDAILIGATLSGNFQGVNISGARLEAADLSAIVPADLASCYFKEPPTYNPRTKFPPGFDPSERLWSRVE